jgi:asparagine synthase (glutamine-hydrolysing)
MQDPTAQLTVVFNGEIYNFRDLRRELAALGHAFRSHSDTEVILAAYREWGVECLTRLNGMFAFAIHDATQRTVFLARDRVGEKPLFFALTDGTLRFASELKGLLADPGFPRRINPQALDMCLAMGYVPGEHCIIKGVQKLPAAHALVFDLSSGVARRWRYWQLPDPPAPTAAAADDPQALLEEFETLLEDAVRLQLEADVPVGVLLSGGVDSSLVTAMAVRASNQVKTFTVSFPGFIRHDESAHARLVAQHFATEHAELEAGQVTPELLPVLARQYDEPLFDSSMIPTYLVSQLVRRHCAVAVGGDGGDELFGGYAHYNRLLWTKERVAWLPRRPRRAVAAAARVLLPTGFKGRNWLRSLSCDLESDSDLPLIASVFDAAERRQLVGHAADGQWQTVSEATWRSRVPRASDLLERLTRMDFAMYMTDDILVKVDRASMLNSLEVRAPLLDYRIIEFAFGRVPGALKTTAQRRKILPKRLAAKLLPPQFDQQRKQGFSIPLAEWLRKDVWRNYFRDTLLDPQSLFDRKVVTALFRGHARGRHNEERLFGLVLFELWRQQYQMAL